MWVETKPTVLVTGAAGFVAMSCIRRLRDRNYKVHGTVRSLEDTAKVGPLKKFFPELTLFEADLLGDGEAFEKAMAGCKYVLHCASPYKLTVADPQKELIDPAVKGTETVMKAAVKMGVSKVVLTSSTASVGPPRSWFTDPAKADKDKVFDEEDWNLTCTIEDGPYPLSKRLAEQKAWEIAKEAESLALVAICPSFVIGPMMGSRDDGESVLFIKGMLDGSLKAKGCTGLPLAVVDVRDVSLAHLQAMEDSEANGKRFIVSSERGYSKIELARMLKDRFKAHPVPTEGPEPEFAPKYNIARAKEQLSFKPRPIEVSMCDMAKAALRNNITEHKYVLKPVKFSQVDKVLPEKRGVDLLVKVVSVTEAEDTKSGLKTVDAVVGDNSGIVTVRLVGEETTHAQKDQVIQVRNAAVRMIKGYISLHVGKWGKVLKHDGTETISPKLDKDMSGTEYELVCS